METLLRFRKVPAIWRLYSLPYSTNLCRPVHPFKSFLLLWNTLQHLTTLCKTSKHFSNTSQYSINTAHPFTSLSLPWYFATLCNTLQHFATLFHQVPIPCNTAQPFLRLSLLWYFATLWNTLQHFTTLFQHVPTLCNTPQPYGTFHSLWKFLHSTLSNSLKHCSTIRKPFICYDVRWHCAILSYRCCLNDGCQARKGYRWPPSSNVLTTSGVRS